MHTRIKGGGSQSCPRAGARPGQESSKHRPGYLFVNLAFPREHSPWEAGHGWAGMKRGKKEIIPALPTGDCSTPSLSKITLTSLLWCSHSLGTFVLLSHPKKTPGWSFPWMSCAARKANRAPPHGTGGHRGCPCHCPSPGCPLPGSRSSLQTPRSWKELKSLQC